MNRCGQSCRALPVAFRVLSGGKAEITVRSERFTDSDVSNTVATSGSGSSKIRASGSAKIVDASSKAGTAGYAGRAGGGVAGLSKLARAPRSGTDKTRQCVVAWLHGEGPNRGRVAGSVGSTGARVRCRGMCERSRRPAGGSPAAFPRVPRLRVDRSLHEGGRPMGTSWRRLRRDCMSCAMRVRSFIWMSSGVSIFCTTSRT